MDEDGVLLALSERVAEKLDSFLQEEEESPPVSKHEKSQGKQRKKRRSKPQASQAQALPAVLKGSHARRTLYDNTDGARNLHRLAIEEEAARKKRPQASAAPVALRQQGMGWLLQPEAPDRGASAPQSDTLYTSLQKASKASKSRRTAHAKGPTNTEKSRSTPGAGAGPGPPNALQELRSKWEQDQERQRRRCRRFASSVRRSPPSDPAEVSDPGLRSTSQGSHQGSYQGSHQGSHTTQSLQPYHPYQQTEESTGQSQRGQVVPKQASGAGPRRMPQLGPSLASSLASSLGLAVAPMTVPPLAVRAVLEPLLRSLRRRLLHEAWRHWASAKAGIVVWRQRRSEKILLLQYCMRVALQRRRGKRFCAELERRKHDAATLIAANQRRIQSASLVAQRQEERQWQMEVQAAVTLQRWFRWWVAGPALARLASLRSLEDQFRRTVSRRKPGQFFADPLTWSPESLMDRRLATTLSKVLAAPFQTYHILPKLRSIARLRSFVVKVGEEEQQRLEVQRRDRVVCQRERQLMQREELNQRQLIDGFGRFLRASIDADALAKQEQEAADARELARHLQWKEDTKRRAREQKAREREEVQKVLAFRQAEALIQEDTTVDDRCDVERELMAREDWLERQRLLQVVDTARQEQLLQGELLRLPAIKSAQSAWAVNGASPLPAFGFASDLDTSIRVHLKARTQQPV